MINNKKIVVVMPAYNAEKTLKKTIQDLPKVYERIILCDDHSQDNTLSVAENLDLEIVAHDKNLGYGANQKTLFKQLKQYNPYIIILVHPDNQYNTSILPQAIQMIKNKEADFILGSRMQTAKEDGMPWWKRSGNYFLSFWQRLIFSSRLSEFHSGLRIFRADILSKMPYNNFSNDFVFDSQVLAWCFGHKLKVKELPTHCYYNNEVSSVNLRRSIQYGFETLKVLIDYLFTKKYKNIIH